MPLNLNNTEGVVSAPPEPEIYVRTMATDKKVLEESGGQVTSSDQIFEPPPRPEPPQNEGLNITGYAGPEQPVFKTSGIGAGPAPSPQMRKPAPLHVWKTVLIAVLILAIIIGFGLLGYFIIFPWLFH